MPWSRSSKDWSRPSRSWPSSEQARCIPSTRFNDYADAWFLDFTVAVGEFADTIAALSVSDLSKQLTNSLSVLADVERLYKDLQDSQAKDDMMTIMGTGMCLIQSRRMTPLIEFGI